MPPPKISLTAKLTAYMRQFTDIPFARDVSDLVSARRAFDHLLRERHLNADALTWYAPILEARYKSITEMIRRTGARQVLEIAAGLSLRGLALTADPAFLHYAETDLDELHAERAKLLASVMRRHRFPARPNLQQLAANALDPVDLARATENFNEREPIAVVHEGLLQYLTSSETEKVATNIRMLLNKFGGVWITPDFSLKADAALVTDQQRRFREIVNEATDRSMYHNVFNDSEHLNTYFRDLGLQIEVFNQLYLVRELSSAHLMPPDQLEELKPRMRLWVLRLDSNR